MTRSGIFEQRLAKAKNDLALRPCRTGRCRPALLNARRKIIAGAIALEHFEKDAGSEWGKIYFRLLNDNALPKDRHLFGLRIPTKAATNSNLIAATIPI